MYVLEKILPEVLLVNVECDSAAFVACTLSNGIFDIVAFWFRASTDGWLELMG